MKKKILASLLAGVMAASVLAGCGSGAASDSAAQDEQTSEAGKSEDNEITVWGWDKNMNGYALEEAQKVYGDGVKVNFVEMAKDDCLTKLHTVLASGVTDDLPDIVLISDLNAQGYLMSYPDAFRPMEDVINYDDFAGYKTAAVSYDGVTYGVPFDSGVAALYYRTDYLSEIGYTDEMMQDLTWDQYLELGEKLKEKGHMLQTFNPNDIAEFQIMLQSTGKWFTDAEGNADFADNDALKECYDIFCRLNDSDFTKVVSDWTEFAGAVNGGDVACVLRGCWMTSTIIQSEDQSGKWKIAPVPKMSTEGATHYSNQGGSSWFVLKNSKNSELAADFLSKTFGGSTELYNTLLSEKSIIGTYLPASDVEAYDQEFEFFGGQQVNKLLADWMSKIPAVDTGAFSAEAQSALLGVTPSILEGGDLTENLQDAEQQFEQSIQ
ncbi:MAG TPA: extracellular solute-binding protein [Candidatus Mediterraneibacter excrementigallinarum]|nr:extracellular solute-binding protein [Candidatus Mediterraneibacter excrementigallinarum]